MSNHDEKDLLTRELRERSSDVGGHPIGLDAVRQSARRIQRRRRALAGTVAAVVLAVAVPTVLSVTDLKSTAPGPVGPGPGPTRTVEPTPTPTPTPPAPKPTPAGDVVLTLSGLRRGPDPAIPYVAGSVLHRPDGSVLDLGQAYYSVVPFRDGWIGTAFAQGEWQVSRLDANGRLLHSAPGSETVAVSADGQQVAYFSSDPSGPGTLTAEGPGNQRLTWRTPPGQQVRPVGMLEPGTVVIETYGTAPKVELATRDGRISQVRGLIAARGASEVAGLVAGQTSSSDTGSCWTVLKPPATARWNTCDFALGQFSPDGRYVVGTEAYGDGLGGGEVALIDVATGKVVARFAKPGNDPLIVASPTVWEDDSHVLAEAFRDGSWTVVRLGLDGSMERATEPVPGEDASPAFHFGARP